MSECDLFNVFWTNYGHLSLSEREHHFLTLSKEEQEKIIHAFYKFGWRDLFAQNEFDSTLDYIKSTFSIDLLSMRIQAIHDGRVFLIEKDIWEHIEDIITAFDEEFHINTDIVFGGLLVQAWGKKRQFYKIRGAKKLTRRN